MDPTYSAGRLIFWGRGLFVGGVVGTLAALAPALLLTLSPTAEPGLTSALAILLGLSVAPLMALVASVGALLLLVGWLRRRRDRP